MQKNKSSMIGIIKKKWDGDGVPEGRVFVFICSLQPYYNSDYVSDCAAQPVLSSSQHAGVVKHHGSVSQ